MDGSDTRMRPCRALFERQHRIGVLNFHCVASHVERRILAHTALQFKIFLKRKKFIRGGLTQ
jgi:hypothetical protein